MGISLLHEHATAYRAIVQRGTRSDRSGRLEQPHILLPRGPCRDDLERLRFECQGDDALDEPVRLGDQVGRRLVDGSIEGQNAAECTERIAGIGSLEGLAEYGSDCRTARVVMLDDHNRGLLKLADKVPGAFEIKDIVEGKFRHVNDGRPIPAAVPVRIDIEGRIDGVLTVSAASSSVQLSVSRSPNQPGRRQYRQRRS